MKTIIKLFLTVISVINLQTTVNSQNISLTLLNPVCNLDGIVVATLTGAASGNYNYHWYVNGLSIINSSSDLTDTIFNFSGGQVIVSAEVNGAFIGMTTDVYPFPFNINSSFSPDTCPLQTGSIALAVTGGVAPLSYSWTFNGAPFGGNTSSLTNLQGGYYDCLITDMVGCKMYLSDILADSGNAPFPNVVSVNNISLATSSTPANCTNGTATVVASGGNIPYTYLWTNGQTTPISTGLSANSQHIATVTDADGCFKMSQLNITSNVNLIINPSITHAHCSDSDGAITVIPTGGSGPYSYLWNTMAVTNNVSGLPAGIYSVTVTDVQGCMQMGFFSINALTPVNVTYSTNPSQCLGATGSATATVTGGIPPYQYEWFTNPVQNTLTASGLAPGVYNIKVTDSQNCIRTGTVTIPQNTTLNLMLSSTPSICLQNNGTATMNATGGSAPYTYSWGSGQTTSSINSRPPELAFGTVTDALGCHLTNCINIEYDSPLDFQLVPQWASCIYVADGSISVNMINGVPPFQYLWSNGQTTATASGLLHGRYWLTITDGNGCVTVRQTVVGYNTVVPCTATLTGRVFIDLNGNCIADASEPGMENIPVWCPTIDEISFTDANGNYFFYVPAGVVTIEQLPMPYRYQVCPGTNPFTINIPANGIIVTRDIADTVDWVNDLTIGVWNHPTPPVVGFTFSQRVVEFNRGTNALASSSQYDYSPLAPFSNATLTPSMLDVANSKAVWDNPLALPLNKRVYDVSFYIPPSVPISTQLYYTDTIFPVSGDTTWWDNAHFHTAVTVGSYDPNYKEVSPAGAGAPGYISHSDSILEYVVHFQNVGNYFATNVVIRDQLDSDLDHNSLRVVYSTHSHTTRINSAGEVEFNFSNIYLPSIEQDTVASNGFVVYSIKLLPNLAEGTEITNSADIFFDFNPPITTNTTINTIQLTGAEEDEQLLTFSVYPNPNPGSFIILFNKYTENHVTLRINNIAGQTVYTSEVIVGTEKVIRVDAGKLPPGIYVLQVISSRKTENARIVIH